MEHKLSTVDAHLDIDEARLAIESELLRVFEHNAHLWWDAPNPRLDGKTPNSLWHADPHRFPDARDSVYQVATTLRTWKPEPLPEQPLTAIQRVGRAIGSIAADIVHL